MKDYDKISAFLFGGLVMFWVMVLVDNNSDANKLHTEATDLKDQCEASLPRNISCEIVVTAVPKEEK